MLGSLHEAQSQGILLLPSFHSTFLLSPLCSSSLLSYLFCARYNGWGRNEVGMVLGCFHFVASSGRNRSDLGTDHPRHNLAGLFLSFSLRT